MESHPHDTLIPFWLWTSNEPFSFVKPIFNQDMYVMSDGMHWFEGHAAWALQGFKWGLPLSDLGPEVSLIAWCVGLYVCGHWESAPFSFKPPFRLGVINMTDEKWRETVYCWSTHSLTYTDSWFRFFRHHPLESIKTVFVKTKRAWHLNATPGGGVLYVTQF